MEHDDPEFEEFTVAPEDLDVRIESSSVSHMCMQIDYLRALESSWNDVKHTQK